MSDVVNLSKIKKFFTREKELVIKEKTTIVLFKGVNDLIDIEIRDVENLDEYLTYLTVEHELEHFNRKYFPKKRILVVWALL